MSAARIEVMVASPAASGFLGVSASSSLDGASIAVRMRLVRRSSSNVANRLTILIVCVMLVCVCVCVKN